MNPVTDTPSEILECPETGRCGGCAWAGRSLFEQKREKMTGLQTHSHAAEWVSCGVSGVRDRADLVWENIAGKMSLGLYGIDSRQVVDIGQCAMMTPRLEAWFKDFRRVAPPIQKGSVRLRVSPSGERGVWLDFANHDVKTLFEQKEYLQWLSRLAFVEIGQRRKKLIFKDGAPKLADPELRPWFETYDGDFKPIPLYGPVGGFSQSGFNANRELVRVVAGAVEKSGLKSWLELFCGNGNFSLALAARGYDVEAIEMDEHALAGLNRSLTPALAAKIQVRRADVYLKTKTLPAMNGRGLLVDPPRAGLREVLAQFEAGPREALPKALVYVSCFADVLAKETLRLEALGYHMQGLTGVDQFPNSPHNEWVALFSLGGL